LLGAWNLDLSILIAEDWIGFVFGEIECLLDL
jgi:hypothetical protein